MLSGGDLSKDIWRDLGPVFVLLKVLPGIAGSLYQDRSVFKAPRLLIPIPARLLFLITSLNFL